MSRKCGTGGGVAGASDRAGCRRGRPPVERSGGRSVTVAPPSSGSWQGQGRGRGRRLAPARPGGRGCRASAVDAVALIFSSYSAASAGDVAAAATLPKNSSRMPEPSTAAQPGAAGVSFEPAADSMSALANWSSPSESTRSRGSPGRGRSRRASAGTPSEKMIFSSSLAPAWFSLACRDGDVRAAGEDRSGTPPSTPGSTKTPNVSSFQVATRLGGVRGVRSEVTDRPVRPAGCDDRRGLGGCPWSSLLLMLTHGVLSASVTGAFEALWNRSWNCSRPLIGLRVGERARPTCRRPSSRARRRWRRSTRCRCASPRRRCRSPTARRSAERLDGLVELLERGRAPRRPAAAQMSLR